MTNQILLTKPQFELVTASEQFPCMVAGFGAGKTNALITRALVRKSAYPKQNVAFYLPTYDLVRTIAFPRFCEALESVGAKYKLIKSPDNAIHIENGGMFLFRSMDNPERIVGYEVADSLVDELDTLKPHDAQNVWNKIISRNRQKKPDGSLNTVAVGTTPEGFRFVYDRWRKNAAQGYRLIRASTYSNARNLPDGYIKSLQDSYPSNLLLAYLEGSFVNLTSGSVYPEFDRNLNKTFATLQDKEPLHIGMDFNVANGSAAVAVFREGNPHFVDEITKTLDTPQMIGIIRAKYPDHPIMIYPDASGGGRRSNNASETDIALLRQAKFTVLNNPRNPAIKDRVLSMNQIIHNKGERRLLVNPDRCPSLVESLEKQAYDKNGEPDKSAGLDHIVDAAGYFITYKFPILRAAQRTQVTGA